LWFLDFGTPGTTGGPVGREQGFPRPALIVSDDRWNALRPPVYMVAPLTLRSRGGPLHVLVQPPEGNLAVVSYVLCEQLRAASWQRFGRYVGTVAPATLAAVEQRVRRLLAL
jgi:mRNA interferase MazF